MKFISLVQGSLGKVRRGVSQSASVGTHAATHDDDSKPTFADIAKTIRGVVTRVNRLEAALPPEGIEFEVNLPGDGSVTELVHNLKSPVRWYVVGWLQTSGVAYPISGPSLAEDSSTLTSLYLRSYVAGRAVIRVEPTQNYVEPGIIVVPTPPVVAAPTEYTLVLTSNFVSNVTAAPGSVSNLKFPIAANEVWRIHYQGGGGDSATGGMAYAVGAPVGATLDAMLYSSSTNITTRQFSQLVSINTLTNCHVGASSAERDDEIIGVIKNGANAGTVSINIATVTGATAATMYAMSSLFAKKASLV